MERSTFLALAGMIAIGGPWAAIGKCYAEARSPVVTLLSAPLELGGEWGGSAPSDVFAVISRMRQACLSGVRLLSDQQPQTLRVDDHTSGLPHTWLHSDHPEMAWIVVDIVSLHWDQLSYQFGHELGHVMCNSWAWGDNSKPPSQWLEEAWVEAFSIRGLGLLADSWEREPPFPHDAAYANAIRKYRGSLIEKYSSGAGPVADAGVAPWFRADHNLLDHQGGLNVIEGPAILAILAELERDKGCVADLGAVNRWPQRSAAPVDEYLRLWRASCEQIGSPGELPARLHDILGLALRPSIAASVVVAQSQDCLHEDDCLMYDRKK